VDAVGLAEQAVRVAVLAAVELSELQAASKHAHAAMMRIRIDSSL